MTSRQEVINITVELFGTARLICGTRAVDIEVGLMCGAEEVSRHLARACPEMVGPVIREDLSGLQDSFVFNRNGLEFVSDKLGLAQGDRLLLFSSQAGG